MARKTSAADISRWKQRGRTRIDTAIGHPERARDMDVQYEKVAAVLRTIGDQLDRDLAAKLNVVFQNPLGDCRGPVNCSGSSPVDDPAHFWIRRWTHFGSVPVRNSLVPACSENRRHFDFFLTCLYYHLAGTVRQRSHRIVNGSHSLTSTCSHLARTLTIFAITCCSLVIRILRSAIGLGSNAN